MARTILERICVTALLGFLLSTAAVPATAEDLDALAVRGEALAAADPLSAELRGRLDAAGRRGFDIGMGIAEGHTAPGPGKQATGESLPLDQQAGYFAAVLFSVTRNANAVAADVGFRIAQADPRLAQARRVDDDPFYALGFDIATGILANRGGGAQTSPTPDPGSANVYQSLAGATRRGFEASANLHGRNPGSSPAGSTATSTPLGDSAARDGSEGVDRVGSVPDVAGMTANQAYSTLTDARYSAEETEINIGPVKPPYNRVYGTTPVAGTTLPAGSKVYYQVPRAWVQKGSNLLTANDQDTRLGFDLDIGKYARIDEGADIYTTSQEFFNSSPYETERQKTRVTVHLNPKASFVTERTLGSNNYPTSNHAIYENCERSFREPTTNPMKFGGAGRYCIITDAGRTASVTLTGSGIAAAVNQTDGSYNFNYVTFDANASGTIKPTGRVYGPGGPTKPTRSICEMAKEARDRNSPAAPGLARKCLESGGSIPTP